MREHFERNEQPCTKILANILSKFSFEMYSLQREGVQVVICQKEKRFFLFLFSFVLFWCIENTKNLKNLCSAGAQAEAKAKTEAEKDFQRIEGKRGHLDPFLSFGILPKSKHHPTNRLK